MNKSLFDKNNIYLDVDCTTQKDAFKFIAKKFVEHNYSNDIKKCYRGLKNREKESSTGFNEGIAIPHAKINEIKHAGVLLIKFKNGIYWDSIDNSLVTCVIALAIPNNSDDANNVHLKMLSAVAIKLIDDDFRKKLKSETDIDNLYQLLSTIKIKV